MWRRIHFWSTLIVFIQLALWTVSGIGFGLLDPNRPVNPSPSPGSVPPGPDPSKIKISPRDLASILGGRFPASPRVTRLSVQNREPTGDPVYKIQVEGEAEPLVVSAVTGEILEPLSAEDAEKIAVRGYGGTGYAAGVERIGEEYQKGYDYYGDLPVFRVNFSDGVHTRFYVSPYTGEIVLKRNVYNSAFNFFWTVHVFGYVDRRVYGNVPMILFGAIAMISLTSGAILHLQYFKIRKDR